MRQGVLGAWLQLVPVWLMLVLLWVLGGGCGGHCGAHLQDAWLDSATVEPKYAAKAAALAAAFAESEKDTEGELSRRELALIKRRIADALQPGETVSTPACPFALYPRYTVPLVRRLLYPTKPESPLARQYAGSSPYPCVYAPLPTVRCWLSLLPFCSAAWRACYKLESLVLDHSATPDLSC